MTINATGRYASYVKRCCKCGGLVVTGYLADDGARYYCSDDCLHLDYTPDEWQAAYDADDDANYYSEWFDCFYEEFVDIMLDFIPEATIKDYIGMSDDDIRDELLAHIQVFEDTPDDLMDDDLRTTYERMKQLYADLEEWG